jgi:hypothetical protein
MTRETKLGLVVAGSFLALVGGVVVARLKHVDVPGEGGEAATVAPTPVAEAAGAPPQPEPKKIKIPASSDAVANAGGAKMPSADQTPPPEPVPAPAAAQPAPTPAPAPTPDPQIPAPAPAPPAPTPAMTTPEPVVPTPAQVELVGPPAPDPMVPAPTPTPAVEQPTPIAAAPMPEPTAPAPTPPTPDPMAPAPAPTPVPTSTVVAPIPEPPAPPPASPTPSVVKQPAVAEAPVAPPPLNPTVAIIPASGGTNTAGLDAPRVPAAGPPRDQFVAPARPVAPPEPKRDSYLEETYRWNPGDNFEALSTKNYGTPKYADALLKYNQDYPLASREMRQNPPAVAPGQVIWVPPVRILERDYTNHIRDLTPIATPTSRATVEPVAPPPGLANSGFGNAAPKLYRVRATGESVQEIARRTLTNAAQAGRIQQLNPTLSPDPRLPIPAGTILRLPGDAKVDAADNP